MRTYELAMTDGNGNVVRPETQPEPQRGPLFDRTLHEIMQRLEGHEF